MKSLPIFLILEHFLNSTEVAEVTSVDSTNHMTLMPEIYFLHLACFMVLAIFKSQIGASHA